MTWVRYDDEFHHHVKVMEARDADPGSLALHLLGNTWTASSKTPGWVPAAVARQLVGAKGKKWAQILVDAKLWDDGELDGKTGWWVHDFEVYNPVDEATKRRRSDSARKAANARWHPEDDAPTHADRMPDAMRDASDPHAETMRPDAIARGHPVPEPVPQETSLRGQRPETLDPTNARCTTHQGMPEPPNCRGCMTARETTERQLEQRKRAAAKARETCPDCHGTGWREDNDGNPAGKCDHRRSA